jgi:hypothetical protein
MVKRKTNQQKKPFYISESESVNATWSQKFTDQLAKDYKRFNIPEALQAKVVANNLAIQSVNQYEVMLLEWLELWRKVKNGIYDGNATNSSPQSFSDRPGFLDLPAPVGAYVLAPHIQAANIILADPIVTEADLISFGLVKAAGKPKPPSSKQRDKAELYNYPLISV